MTTIDVCVALREGVARCIQEYAAVQKQLLQECEIDELCVPRPDSPVGEHGTTVCIERPLESDEVECCSRPDRFTIFSGLSSWANDTTTTARCCERCCTVMVYTHAYSDTVDFVTIQRISILDYPWPYTEVDLTTASDEIPAIREKFMMVYDSAYDMVRWNNFHPWFKRAVIECRDAARSCEREGVTAEKMDK